MAYMLEDATMYAIVVRPSGDIANDTWFIYRTGKTYAGGDGYYLLNDVWTLSSQKDVNFGIYLEGDYYEFYGTSVASTAYGYESAQTFTTTSAHGMDRVAIKCTRFGRSNPDETLTIELQETTDEKPNGNVLMSATIPWNTLPTTVDYMYVDLEAEAAITTDAASEVGYQAAMGNGTIDTGEPTERGFEIRLDFGENKDSNSGTLANYIDHSIAGFEGDVTWNIVYKWNGILTKTETETGTYTTGAYELVLGYPSVLGNPSSVFNDKLFKCESYTYRAYMVIGEDTYYGDYVAFDTLCDAGEDQQPTDDISEGDPVVPPIPPEEEIEYPPFEWEEPEIEIPPFIFPDLPPWEFPDYLPMSWIGDFYYRKPYTKKDLDDLRKKCIIYNRNSIEFALVLRHNMNVLREFFNMMTDYMSTEEFNDFTDLIPPQRLKELYLDPLELNDFRDMINGFIRNTIDNNVAVNRNFKLIQDGLSNYETESDDAYFKEINSNIKTVTEDNPDVHRLKRKIDSLNREVRFNYGNIMRNLKVLRARLL